MRLSTKKALKNGHALASDWVKIKNALSHTGDAFNESIDGIKHKSQRIQKNVSNYTAKKPLKSLGIAMLIGVSVGLLIKRIF